MNKKGIRACVFDFDGVIIDSEKIHAEAKKITLEHFKIPYPEDIFSSFKGRTDRDFFSYVVKNLKPDADGNSMFEFKKSTYYELFPAVELINGISEFLSFVRQKYNKLGIATSATNRDFYLAANKYDLVKRFDAIVTGEDTQHHKPHPEPYEMICRKLELATSEAVIIEDAPNGVRSGKAAGCLVIGITTSFTKQELLESGADQVADTYIEITKFLGSDD